MKPEIAFGIIMKQHRKELKLSQEEIADLSGLDRTFISLLERAQRQPSLNTIISIARSLQIEAHVLVKEVENMIMEDN